MSTEKGYRRVDGCVILYEESAVGSQQLASIDGASYSVLGDEIGIPASFAIQRSS
eukprot:IDg14077t1